MKNNTWKKSLSWLLAMSLVPSLTLGTISVQAAEATAENKLVIDYFTNPDAHAKPMARMWFPDAGAGEDDNDLIEKQILELAEKGFGGVEVAMLADGVSYNNEEGRQYGWGTENWSKLLKKVLKAAAKVPGGFQVDMTITAHWPPTLNTIDPNDDAANKELSYSLTKITSQDLQNGTLALKLPEQKTNGPAGGFGGKGAYEHFLFTDTFVSAAVAKISAVNVIPGEDGAEDTISYEFDFPSLQSITDNVETVPDGGYAAGVPDRETAEAYGWDYDEICEFFGPESEGPWTQNNGKQDDNLNRKRMADWQNEYTASLEGMDLETVNDSEELAEGDWVVLSTFYRGTGQSIPGGRIMHNGVFVTNYFNEAGTSAVTGFWDEMLENDPELYSLMQENPGYIFEDSIEASSVSSYWASTIMEDVAEDYAYKDILPVIAASKYISSGFMGVTTTDFFSFSGDNGLVSRIYEDYNDKLAELYVKYRVNGVTNWAKEKLGWGFRGQTYHLPGLEIGRAAMVADVAECDNMSKGDGVRYQSGTVNLTGHDFLTMEAITGPTIGYVTMDDVLTELGQNYSDGVNRAILHGTPYAKTFNGYNSDWPGWLPFGPSSFGSSYTYREAYWKDFDTELNFMSRVQGVLQNGEAKIDLAVLIDQEKTYDFESGNRFQNLLDQGYSYNLVSESVLDQESASVTDGILAADGPSYKALIVDRVSILSVDGIEKLNEYAENGLPIILYSSDISRVYGSDLDADGKVVEGFEKLSQMPGVRTAESLEEIEAALADAGITSYAKYSTPQLESTMYKDNEDGTNYYYLFNNAFPENSGMMGNTQGAEYKGEDKIIRNAEVTLEGNGTPYLLDPYTGEITKIDQYTQNDNGSVTFTLDTLYGGNAVICAVTENIDRFDTEAAEAKPTVTESQEVIDLSNEQWNLTIHSYGPSEDSVDPSDSTITTVDFGSQTLGKWKDLAATEDQLKTLGVEDMKFVSGTGEYSITFTTPENWSAYAGAALDVSYGKDQIGSITVNGTILNANNASDHVDLGTLLVSGENTISIKLHTSLYGRTFIENSGYTDTQFGMGSGFMAEPDPEAYYNGLLSVKVTPYTQETVSE